MRAVPTQAATPEWVYYSLALSHGTAPTLGATFAASLASPVMVFNGALDNSPASATFYTGRRMFGAASDLASGTVANSMIDTRFALQ